MNTKSILIATLLAAVSGAAFAQSATPAAPAEKIESVQIAQATIATRNAAPSYRAGSNAVTSQCPSTYNDATSMIVCPNPDSRTRAQVREETRAWLNSPEGKAARAQMVGAF